MAVAWSYSWLRYVAFGLGVLVPIFPPKEDVTSPPVSACSQTESAHSAGLPIESAPSAGSNHDDATGYSVYHYYWRLRRTDFASLKLYVYASLWAFLINSGLMSKDSSDESETCFATDVTCTEALDNKGRALLILKTPHDLPQCFKGGARILWSLTDPDLDGFHKCTMTIDSRQGRTIWIMEPDRVPAGYLQQTWRLDVITDRNQTSRLLQALHSFTAPDVQSVNLQTLIANESDDGDEMRRLNVWQPGDDHLQEVDRICAEHRLNGSQKQALLSSLSHHVSLIQGPPGTGKTKTAVAILRLHHKVLQYIYACAPSNLAIDTIGVQLLFWNVAISRFGDRRRLSKPFAEKIRPHSIEEHVHDELRGYSYKSPAYNKWKSQIYTRDLLESGHRVWTGTVDSAATGTVLDQKKVPYSLVDEAGQCTEAQLLPVFNASQRVTLVGDHQQLPPNTASEMMNKSLLERLNGQDGFDFIMLDLQYRMRPELCAWPSRYFYYDRLRSFWPATAPSDLISGFDWPFSTPVAFWHVSGKETPRSSSDRSWQNLLEAEAVTSMVQEFLRAGQITAKDISIITPYASQRDVLKRSLHDKVDVDTVDACQGQERDLVILSLVRTNTRNAHGFLSEPRRLNVAITRAKRGLVIVGDAVFWKHGTSHFFNLLSDFEKRQLIMNLSNTSEELLGQVTCASTEDETTMQTGLSGRVTVCV